MLTRSVGLAINWCWKVILRLNFSPASEVRCEVQKKQWKPHKCNQDSKKAANTTMPFFFFIDIQTANIPTSSKTIDKIRKYYIQKLKKFVFGRERIIELRFEVHLRMAPHNLHQVIVKTILRCLNLYEMGSPCGAQMRLVFTIFPFWIHTLSQLNLKQIKRKIIQIHKSLTKNHSIKLLFFTHSTVNMIDGEEYLLIQWASRSWERLDSINSFRFRIRCSKWYQPLYL